MIEVRLAKKGEIVSLKELWKLCFGDQDSYIDLYFANRYNKDETLVLLLNGEIVSMLTTIPVKIVFGENRSFDSVMLYAIATHPQYQNQGLGTQLMEASHQYLAAQNMDFTVLVPAGQNLINFYRKQGYRECFYVREIILPYDMVSSMTVSSSQHCTISPVEPQEYNARRDDWLKGKFHVAYEDKEIQYQKKLSQHSGADIYAIDFEGIKGCAVVERITADKVLIKEMLLPEVFIHSAIKEVICLLPAKEYRLRTSACLGGNLGGVTRPFAMIKAHKEFDLEIICRDQGYLGIAYD